MEEIAAGLDEIRRSLDLRIAFFCNECRSGDGFDRAASLQIRRRTSEPALSRTNLELIRKLPPYAEVLSDSLPPV